MSIPSNIKRLFEAWGAQGGRTRAKRLSSTKRREIAKKAAQGRWGTRRPKKTS